ncbi:hypothetical protein SPRG_04578 [Saprolegnia parasitica CBS 223.65]|uniref:Uncharacterized protein n=1 Tax=Saprolegnia parasitica (strain CBS 223.65) TaxID=695850 RepID=A0A067CV94_SAPPC|nr:hypothetical protein SPRG_04578 [Saprolegnia parasitica CBS 223.65]KDO30677.1 hypothetical protein SPRG_04578 [Saprolegnia parasitica CBS 223.65]|eukprot:XP_012198381.1 hypothetical protein SPRG_04578 [Saprolegnia parasitica CBS 223.65]
MCNPVHGVEAELAKVRAEGDWVLIKIEMEKKAMEATMAALAEAQDEMKRLRAAKSASRAKPDHPRQRKQLADHEQRLHVALQAKRQHIATLRLAVDEARRTKLDAAAALAAEEACASDWESKIKRAAADLETALSNDARVADEIKRLQAEIDANESAFLAQKQQLAAELQQPLIERTHKAYRAHKLEYRKKSNLSWLKKIDLVKRTESLERKKELLDYALSATQAPNVAALLTTFLAQEAKKNAVATALAGRASRHAQVLATMADVEAELAKLQLAEVHANPFRADLVAALEASRDRANVVAAESATVASTLTQLESPIAALYELAFETLPTEMMSIVWSAPHLLPSLLARVEARVSEQVLSCVATACQGVADSSTWPSLPLVARFLELRGATRHPATPPPVVPPSIMTHGNSSKDTADDDDKWPVHSKALLAALHAKHDAAKQ